MNVNIEVNSEGIEQTSCTQNRKHDSLIYHVAMWAPRMACPAHSQETRDASRSL